MKDNYRKLGEYIQPVDVRNSDLRVSRLLGLSIEKCFIESIANTIGTDFRPYKIVKKGQFAYGPVTSRNGDKITIALLEEPECIISSSYAVFEITDTSKLLPEYLMLWFSRPEFDRYARFKSHGSVREIFDWDEMCRVELPVPDLTEQQRIVNAYNTVNRRIYHLQQINEKLEKAAQTIYKNAIEMKSEKESLYQTTEIKNGYPFDSDLFNENFEGLPLIRIRDIKSCNPIVYTTETSSRAEVIKLGDLLVGMDGEFSPNFWFGEDSLLNQRVCKLVPIKNYIHPFFIYFSIKPILENLEKTQGGTTVIHVGKKDFDKMQFASLPESEHKVLFKNLDYFYKLFLQTKREIFLLQRSKNLIISHMSEM